MSFALVNEFSAELDSSIFLLKNLVVCDATDENILMHANQSMAPKLYIRDVSFPLDAITMFLRHNPVDTLHIICHGRKGAIKLGKKWITADYLHDNSLLISQWKTNRIALWSSQTGVYREFCEALSGLTGAEVFSTTSEISNYDLDSGLKLSAGDNRLGIDSLLGSRKALA